MAAVVEVVLGGWGSPNLGSVVVVLDLPSAWLGLAFVAGFYYSCGCVSSRLPFLFLISVYTLCRRV